MDSLDWIRDDFRSHNLGESDEEFDDDSDFYGNGIDIDSGSDSDIGCSMFVGDEKTALELEAFAKEVEKRYCQRDVDVDDDDDVESELNATEFIGDDESEDKSVRGFGVDALEAAKKNLPEVQLVWKDTLDRCTVNE